MSIFEERRAFKVLDVIEALAPLSQPGLLESIEEGNMIIPQKSNIAATTGNVIAPMPRKNQ